MYRPGKKLHLLLSPALAQLRAHRDSPSSIHAPARVPPLPLTTNSTSRNRFLPAGVSRTETSARPTPLTPLLPQRSPPNRDPRLSSVQSRSSTSSPFSSRKKDRILLPDELRNISVSSWRVKVVIRFGTLRRRNISCPPCTRIIRRGLHTSASRADRSIVSEERSRLALRPRLKCWASRSSAATSLCAFRSTPPSTRNAFSPPSSFRVALRLR